MLTQCMQLPDASSLTISRQKKWSIGNPDLIALRERDMDGYSEWANQVFRCLFGMGNETEEQALHREFKKRALSLAGQIVQAKNEMVQARLDMAWSNLNPLRRFHAFFTSRARRERASLGWRYSGLESDHEFKSKSVSISSSSLATMILRAADARKTRADHDYETVRLHVNSNRGLSPAFWFPPIEVGCIAALTASPRRSSRWESIQSIYTPRFCPDTRQVGWNLYEKSNFGTLAGHTGGLHALSISDLARSKLDASGWK